MWDEIRAETALRERFWLGLLFGAGRRDLDEFVARSRDIARAAARHVEEIPVGDGVEAVMKMLLTSRPGLLLTWLTDDTTAPGAVREAQWSVVLARLNERRDVLAEARPSGLILACPELVRPTVRDMAPDLWSFRTLTADVGPEHDVASPGSFARPVPGAPKPASPDPDRSDVTTSVERTQVAADVAELLRRASAALGANRPGAALAHLRAADLHAATPVERGTIDAWRAMALLALDETAEACRYARAALAVLETVAPEMRADLFEILVGSVDPVEAQEAAAELVEQRRQEWTARRSAHTSAVLSRALDMFGRSLQIVGDLEGARSAFVEALSLDRERQTGDNFDLTYLAMSVFRVGDVEREVGDLASAHGHHAEALGLRRELAGRDRTPENLALVGSSLDQLGNIEEALGDLDGAYARYRESLKIRRELHAAATDEDDVAALENLTDSLDNMGDVERERGDLGAARRHFEEALQISRRVATARETPATLYSLTLALDRVGHLEMKLGNVDTAHAHYTEALTIARRLYVSQPIPRRLSTLSLSLHRVGETELTRENLDAARTHFTEALAINRDLAAAQGTPDVLQALAYSVTRMGVIAEARKDIDTARGHFTEALDLRRRLVADRETPTSLRALSASLDDLGTVEAERGDLNAARQSYNEALRIDRRLHADRENPDTITSLIIALGRMGNVSVQDGDHSIALAFYRERLDLGRRLLDQFGETLDALRGLASSAWELASVYLALGDRTSALDRTMESAELLERICTEFGAAAPDIDTIRYINERISELRTDGA